MIGKKGKAYHELRGQFMKSVEEAEKKQSERNFGEFFTTQQQRNKGAEDRRFITVLDESGKLVPVDIGLRAQAGKGIGNMLNLFSENRWTLNLASDGDKSVSLSKELSASPILAKAHLRVSKEKENQVSETPDIKPAKELKGLLLLNDPMKILELSRKNQAQFSFDNLDTFPATIQDIFKMPEELGQLGVRKDLQERLKRALTAGTSSHSILKKNYFFLDENVDVDLYSDISSYSRKVIRHSK